MDIPLAAFHANTVPVCHSLSSYLMRLTAHQTTLKTILKTALSAKCLEELTNLEMPDIFDASGIQGSDITELETKWNNLRLHQRLSLLLAELKRNLISEAQTEE